MDLSSAEKREKESNSSVTFEDERNQVVVTKIRYSGVHLYSTTIQREEKLLFLWLNALFFTESDCVHLARQLSDFLSFLYLPGEFQPDYLDHLVAQIGSDKAPNENCEFKAPGAHGWRFALRDYSHTVPGMWKRLCIDYFHPIRFFYY